MFAQWVGRAEWTPGESMQLRVRRRLRRLVLRVADPVVRYPAPGGELRLPLSHEMPRYRRLHPTYDLPLEEIATVIRARVDTTFRVIDVGGNVGDSALALLANGVDAVLCVEGVERYLRLLHDNVGRLGARVAVAPYFVTEKAQSMKSHVARGTATVTPSGPAGMASITFTDLLIRHPAFADAQLLKIDTDGWDQAVLRSASDWLKERQPAVFFEHDPMLQQNQGYDAAAVWTLLDGLGYRSAQLWSNTGLTLWQGDLNSAVASAEGYLTQYPYLDVLATADATL